MSIEKFNVELTPEFNKMISDSLTERVGDEFDIQLKRLQERKNEIVAGILLSIKKEVDCRAIGETVTFTIREITK